MRTVSQNRSDGIRSAFTDYCLNTAMVLGVQKEEAPESNVISVEEKSHLQPPKKIIIITQILHSNGQGLAQLSLPTYPRVPIFKVPAALGHT